MYEGGFESMLQIISGKFFDKGKINKQETHAVLYSNYSYVSAVDFGVVKLIPLQFFRGSIECYIMEFDNKYQPYEGDILYLPVHYPVVEQFQLLLSFYLQAIFHEEKNYIELKCRKKSQNSNDELVPSLFIPRFFSEKIDGTESEISDFSDFLKKVISIPRKQYNLVISCIKTYINALEVFEYNFELSYSMFVYVLETISQNIIQKKQIWDDYHSDIKSKLEKIFCKIDNSIAEEIKEVLLTGSHLKLKQNFIDGIQKIINSDFYIKASTNVARPIPKSELPRALYNLYDNRSGYVHKLNTVIDQLKQPHFLNAEDYIIWDNEPYLTISGLVRLVRHVLLQFINSQESLETEKCNWRDELPGIIKVKIAPEVWLSHGENIRKESAVNYFNGFLEYLTTSLNRKKALPDMRNILIQFENLFNSSTKEQKLCMLSVYWLYNILIEDTSKSENYEKLTKKYEQELNVCSIQSIIISLFYKSQLIWSASECAAVFNEYKSKKYKINQINIPVKIEINIMTKIANQYLIENNESDYFDWANKALYDSAGIKGYQDIIIECIKQKKEIEIYFYIGE
ncbi:hypothetical protein FACS1894130_03030 [Spirochaetia bacterium]|nr:hypothetical protein FACS1894130_03030 [Spirochaetia bacterium]